MSKPIQCIKEVQLNVIIAGGIAVWRKINVIDGSIQARFGYGLAA